MSSAIYDLGQTILIGPSTVDQDGLELRDADGALVDASTNTLVVTAPDGTIDTYADVTHVSTGVYAKAQTLDQAGVWSWRWEFTVAGQVSVETGRVAVSPSPNLVEARPAFATVLDLSRYLGRDLTPAEIDRAIELLACATTDIAVAVGRDDDWALDLTPIPGGLRTLCVQIAARALEVPLGVRGTQEQLGAYLHSVTYAAGEYGSGLTDEEARRARRIVYGTNSGSVRVLSILDDIPTDAEVGS